MGKANIAGTKYGFVIEKGKNSSRNFQNSYFNDINQPALRLYTGEGLSLSTSIFLVEAYFTTLCSATTLFRAMYGYSPSNMKETLLVKLLEDGLIYPPYSRRILTDKGRRLVARYI